MSVDNTKPENAYLAPIGLPRLPSGIWVTGVPLMDREHAGLTAQLHQKHANGIVRERLSDETKRKLRLISSSTILELARVAVRPDPVVLPNAAQRAAMPRNPGEGRDHYEGRIRKEMASLEWRTIHDSETWKQLNDMNWDGVTPALIGKFFRGGAPAGKVAIFGGLYRDGTWANPDMITFHNELHSDYMTKVMYETNDPPVFDIDTTKPKSNIRERLVAWAEGERAAGVQESPPGSNDSPRIREYFKAPFMRDGAPIQINKTKWCAAAACYGLHTVANGETIPVLRVSGIELETDAKRDKRWSKIGRPGDLAIFKTTSTDPNYAQWGRHVTIIKEWPEKGDSFVTIGGNENNRWQVTNRLKSHPDYLGAVRIGE